MLSFAVGLVSAMACFSWLSAPLSLRSVGLVGAVTRISFAVGLVSAMTCFSSA